MKRLSLFIGAVLAVMGCDSTDSSDGSGSNYEGPKCEAVGDLVVFGEGSRPQVAAVAGGYIVTVADIGSGNSLFLTDGDPTPMQWVPPREFVLLGDGTTAHLMNYTQLSNDGLRLYPWVNDDWGNDPIIEGPAPEPSQTFISRLSAAIADDGSVFAAWSEGLGGRQTLWGQRFDAQGSPGPLLDLLPDSFNVGSEVHVAFGADGMVHVITPSRSDTEGDTTLFLVQVNADDSVDPPVALGLATSSLANTTVIGIARTESETYIAEISNAEIDFDAGDTVDGALTVWRHTGETFEVINRHPVKRFVTNGLAMAPMVGDQTVISAAFGENNASFAESNDSVELWICGIDGCSPPVVVRGQRGAFYKASAIAIRGNEGLVVWAEDPKGPGDSEEMVKGQRFICQ